MKQKTELKAALDALQVRKPLRLPAVAPTFAPPPVPTQVPTATEVTPETQVRSNTRVSLETPAPVATGVATEVSVDRATQVSAMTLVLPDTQALPVSAENQGERVTSFYGETLVPSPTQVAQATEVSTLTGVGEKAKVAAKAQVPLAIEVSIATQVSPPTGVTLPSMVPGDTRVPTPTQAPATKAAAPEPAPSWHPPRRASEQDSAVILEAQASPKLQNGYTRVPNSLLMRMVSGDLLRSEMQVALLIGRLTISYQQRLAPISKAVIERQTGLRGPAVLQALSDLLAKGLIEKIPGDQNRPNQFGLVGAEECLASGKTIGAQRSSPARAPVPPATPVSWGTHVPRETSARVAAETSAPVATETPAGVPVGTHFKDSERYKSSLSPLPEKLRNYFADLKPARKRESEWASYQQLRAEYSADDIADALDYLQKRGIGAGDASRPCHSPMAYLSKAIGEILLTAREEKRKALERAERERAKAEVDQQRLDADAREVEEWAVKERAFNDAFPSRDMQAAAIAELLHGVPFGPNSQAGRVMAIGRWWEELNAKGAAPH